MPATPPLPPDKKPILRLGTDRWSLKLYTPLSVVLFFTAFVAIAALLVNFAMYLDLSFYLGRAK